MNHPTYKNLYHRSSYRTRTGVLIHVWSDPDEPELEIFDNTFTCPSEWVQGNAWIFQSKNPRRDEPKKKRARQSQERDNREAPETLYLKSL